MPKPNKQQVLSRPIASEHEEALAVMGWRGVMMSRYPELGLLYHIANEGSGSVWQGVKRKQEGVLAGMLDYCLTVARRGNTAHLYHAWYGELKRLGETWGEGQEEMAMRLRAEGNRVDLCVGGQAMITALEDYLEVPANLRTVLFL